jgi:hypothetical protein
MLVPSAAFAQAQSIDQDKVSEMNRYRLSLRMLIMIFGITVPVAGFAQAQTAPTSPDLEEAKLEQEFTDPLTTLPQVIIRDSYSPANYGTNVQTNQFIIRPLIPRIPPRTFLPFDQLIWPTFALATVPGGGHTRPMSQVTSIPTRQPRITSAILRTPTSAALIFE